VDGLLGNIQRVAAAASTAKQASGESLDALNVLLTGNFAGGAGPAHHQLVEKITLSEEQSVELGASLEAMKAAAEPIFERWTTDLAAFTNPDLRQRSQIRLTETRGRYLEILAAVEPAKANCDQVNSTLRDHALFLGNDFNASAVSALAIDTASLKHRALELDRHLDAALMATQSYTNAATPPGVPR
jgi:hypothetical protein